MKFPDHGELFPSKNKKYQELIFFVPYFEGSKKSLKKHIELVNELGFDAFIFKPQDHFSLFNLPITSELKFGLQHQITNQIENLLNQLDRKKIIFAFSGLANNAIEAIAKRNANDIKALICDSGPSNEFLKSIYNFLEHKKGLSLAKRLIQWPIFSLAWNPQLKNNLHNDLEKFPAHFKILSIRGWKDKLMPPTYIDAVFEPHKQLDWRKLSFPQSEHMQSLTDSPKEYHTGLKNFLQEVATKAPKK